ncbi:hypothetical protein [Pseudomonas aeruginosa]|uniref:hypothetical protein n=1 Tax=Pseudomonas aeruginosa TaxID=287 RepID=UPI0026EC9C40|nr:hypothetical protein [Pseudomonas aeruginosa]
MTGLPEHNFPAFHAEAARLRGIVEALDNIHDNTPHRWSTDLDDVHSSAESLLALIKDQAPALDAQGLAQSSPAQAEQPAADYEKVLADHRRLVRELDVLLNREEGAAKQASLCDLVGQVSAIVRERRVPLLSRSQAEDAPVIGCLCGMPMAEGHHSPDGCSSLGEFATHVVVPREVLERSIDRWACCAMSQTPGAEEAWEELRALLSEQEGGSDHA